MADGLAKAKSRGSFHNDLDFGSMFSCLYDDRARRIGGTGSNHDSRAALSLYAKDN